MARPLRAAERAAQACDKGEPKWQAAIAEIREIMRAARL